MNDAREVLSAEREAAHSLVSFLATLPPLHTVLLEAWMRENAKRVHQVKWHHVPIETFDDHDIRLLAYQLAVQECDRINEALGLS